jgi:IS605 OrfB family transposase
MGSYVTDEIHHFPFAKLRSFIEHKAHEPGIEVLTMDEANTPPHCNRCPQ